MAWRFFKSKKKHDCSKWPFRWGHSCFVWFKGPVVSYLGVTIYDRLFTKCFHEKLQYILKGELTLQPSHQAGVFTAHPLDVFQMIFCWIFVIRNVISSWSVSDMKSTQTASISWGRWVWGHLSGWWVSPFETYEDSPELSSSLCKVWKTRGWFQIVSLFNFLKFVKSPGWWLNFLNKDVHSSCKNYLCQALTL